MNGDADTFRALAFEPARTEEVSESEETGLTIDPAFWVRLAKPARKQGLSVVPIHTHPFTQAAPAFSRRDRAGELSLQPVLERLTGRPSAAVVMGERLETVGRFQDGKRLEGTVRSIGESPTRAATVAIDSEVFSRHIRAFGEEGQQRLQSLRVGVVGASGTGSHVCEQLIRLGVGELIVVDSDVVSRVNLNRIVTASGNDAAEERAKVDTVRDYAAWAATGTEVVGVRGDLLDTAVSERVRTVDALFGCTDTIASRAILNRIAVQHFIPYWDCGTEISAGHGLRAYGRMRVVLAGGPCLYCSGVIDPEALRVELLDPAQRDLERARGYIRGAQAPAPSVVSINAVVASLAVTSFLRWVVGGEPIDGGEWIFRSYAGDVRRQEAQRDPQCPVCSTGARLGRADLPVGLSQ
ncbi:MAG: ThiF family adenylyltransferase [Candidatus Dormibacter sp.]